MTDPQLPGITFYAKDKHGVEVQIALPVLDAAKIGAIADSLHDQGFTRSERLEPRSFGGGQRPGFTRPEEKPPEDLIVPEHCGEPMVYKPPKEATGERKAISARWECRKGRNCAEAEERGGNRYGFTDWHMKKKPATDAKVPQERTERASAAKPAQAVSHGAKLDAGRYTAFWKALKDAGYDSKTVTEAVYSKYEKEIPDLTAEELEHVEKTLLAAARGEAVAP